MLSFQFPTGWNSTQEQPLIDNPNVVSIPNGMEFYCRFPRLPRFAPRCFNSQRDGILQSAPAPKLRKASTFQFPTGWNSTEVIFNRALQPKLFQFPTGWNSTYRRLLGRLCLKFQFPTGWNSTFIFCASASEILTFQFPTGWNSTPRIAGISNS